MLLKNLAMKVYWQVQSYFLPKKPKTLWDCPSKFEKVFHIPEQFQDFLNTNPEDLITYHNDLGRWIRNNWGLWWENSALEKHLKSLGLTAPDDMSMVVIKYSHAQLNNYHYDLEADIKKYQKYWNDIKETISKASNIRNET